MKPAKEKSIVVVGVSRKKDKFGYRIFKGLIDNGFKVSGVNPSVTEQVVEQCRQLKVPEIWMQPGSESEKAINQAESFGISVIHDACFMVEQGVW